MEINHFSHGHPLFLSEEKRNKDFPCRVCGEPIFGISYCCMTCPFVLHKWCSELPRELSFHKSHLPDHPLVLTPERPPGSSSLADCKICKKEIKTPGSAYTCIANECCSFNLHVECASFTGMINFEYLKTSTTLYFLRKYEENKKCHICGYNCSGPLLFSLSGVHVHVQCVMLPRIVKHRVHLHELTLCPPLKEKEWYFEFFCDACETERDPCHHVYYCEPCEFVAHIGCGVAGLDRPIQDILGTCSVYQISKCVKEEEEEEEVSKIVELEEDDEPSNCVEEEEEDAEKVELFGHEHPFVLVNYTRPLKHKCGGCHIPIFGMAYFCKNCDIRLHKWCAQLPKEIRRQMNQHFMLFKLICKTKGLLVEAKDNLSDEEPLEDYEDIAEEPWEDDEDKVSNYPHHNYPRCNACKIRIRSWEGYYNESKRSNIKLHLTCAMLPSNLNHPSHEHTLCEAYITSPKPSCQACGFQCEGVFSLECESCNFYLHVHCFLLPPTAKHIAHRHTLNLTYSYSEASWALEYFCDACEKPRTPNRWVYCCPDPKCEIVVHIDCAVPKYFTAFEHQNQSTSS